MGSEVYSRRILGSLLPIVIVSFIVITGAPWEESVTRYGFQIHDLSHEEVFVFDYDGNVLYHGVGNEDSVDVPLYLIRNNIVLHNHPNFDPYASSTFSSADLELFFTFRPNTAIVVGPHEIHIMGKTTYNMVYYPPLQ